MNGRALHLQWYAIEAQQDRPRLGVPVSNPCNCIGPQDGQPLCPCQMRGVVVKNGRYVMPERDLGPALDADELASVKRQREQIERDLASNRALTRIPPLR